MLLYGATGPVGTLSTNVPLTSAVGRCRALRAQEQMDELRAELQAAKNERVPWSTVEYRGVPTVGSESVACHGPTIQLPSARPVNQTHSYEYCIPTGVFHRVTAEGLPRGSLPAGERNPRHVRVPCSCRARDPAGWATVVRHVSLGAMRQAAYVCVP